MPSYRFMVTAIDAIGHINAVLGFSEALQAAGHEICFVHREKHRHLAVKRGFQFIPFDETVWKANLDEIMLKWLDSLSSRFKQDPLQRFLEISPTEHEGYKAQGSFFVIMNEAIDRILSDKNNKFDALLVDLAAPFPALHKHPVLWFPLMSSAPLALYPSGPPYTSGYSVYSDKSKWEEYRKALREAHSEIIKIIQGNLDAYGLSHIRFDPTYWHDEPQTVGFYHYPAALDYTECGPRSKNWYGIDCLVRQPDFDTDFVIPENLKNKPGKLIYFSLGSLGSADASLMQKFIDILSKSPHKFIISKGVRGDQLKLGDNMWGENYVDQIKVVQNVDLVITHGGNNTFIETLYYGKPMIVIPYFYDQFDNAQRVVDKKIGFRVNLYDLDEDYLLNCIENVFNDNEIQNRVKAISQNMRNSKSLSNAIKMMEKRIEQKNNSS
ncbi:sterol 3-beta-glucosyltransferase-like [Tetranychus urticae]|uniref:UDP-glycosyltransferase 201B7 n=1 Tax=Tetranychus urticae TaxID=32264 RepID=T1K549_TETUR|nr:sterol 3-beta-glucosyltransferase-like [Tetranychus urticae]AHX56854.1 UDP-glycosyltransferase 201B7 [Tetranychus urticae]